MMIEKLKRLKFKNLPTLNQFVERGNDLKSIKEYAKFLRKTPKRTDFIPFDDDGFELNEVEPIFEGWQVCEETSSEAKKVARKGDNRVYFDAKEGVIVMNLRNVSDNVTYNDLAIFFEGKLKLN